MMSEQSTLLTWIGAIAAAVSAGVAVLGARASKKSAEIACQHKDAAQEAVKSLARIAESQERLTEHTTRKAGLKGELTGTPASAPLKDGNKIWLSAVMDGTGPISIERVRIRCNDGEYFDMPKQTISNVSMPVEFTGDGKEHRFMFQLDQILEQARGNHENPTSPYKLEVMLVSTKSDEYPVAEGIFNPKQ